MSINKQELYKKLAYTIMDMDVYEYFVPERFLCSDAMYAVLDVLKPDIKAKDCEFPPNGNLISAVAMVEVARSYGR